VRDVFDEVLTSYGMHAHLIDPAEPVVSAVIERFTVSGTGKTVVHTSAPSAVFNGLAERATRGEYNLTI
jgi:hypothetical protein